MQKSGPIPRAIQAPTATPPQRGSLFLWYTAHQATFRTPTLTPHGDAFLHHLWSGVAQYSAYELTLGKRKVRDQGRGGRTCHLDILGICHWRPAHFHSWVAGSGVQYIDLKCTPLHQRGKLGTLHHRIVGIRMTNGTGHWPMHSASLGNEMSSLDFNWDITQQGRLLILSKHWCCQHQQQRCVAFSLASTSEPVQHG